MAERSFIWTVPRTVRRPKDGVSGKRAIFKRLLPVLLTTIILISCSQIGCAKMEPKGGNIKMKKYMIGRFKVDMPEDMILSVRRSKLRFTKLEEHLIPQHSAAHQQFIDKIWNDHLSEIMKLRPPEEKEQVIKEKRDFPEISKGTKSVFYYGNYVMYDKVQLDVLIDAGPVAFLLKHAGAFEDEPVKQQEMMDDIIDIAKAYRAGYPAASIPGDWFYLERGALNLPYLRNESFFVKFTNESHDLKLAIDMHVTFENEAPEHGLLGRVAAALMTSLATGVDVDRIRSQKRVLGGLKGEEEVDRMSTKNQDTKLSFAWRYAGEANSGERPQILITMESPDGNLEEKLKIWDAILDSFQPAYKRTK